MVKKVLVLSNMYPSARDKSYGRFVQICAEGLIEAGFDVDVVGIARYSNPLSKLLAYLRFSLEANYRLIFRKYDCIYIHHPLHTLIASYPSVFLYPGKVALNFHGHDLIPVTWRGAFLKRLVSGFFARAKTVIVPSEHFKRVFESTCARPSGRAPKVFYSGGVGEQYFVAQPAAFTSRPPSALFLSRMVIGKGWDEFLRIARRLATSNPGMTFTVAGIGPDVEKIRAEIASMGIGQWVTVVESSTISSNLALYDRHRYFVFPTRFDESLALVNLEAMARGCIVFSADFPTAAEYIDQGSNGYRFPLAGFEEKVCAEIARLEHDPVRAANISDAAKHAAQRFRESVIMDKLPMVLEVQQLN